MTHDRPPKRIWTRDLDGTGSQHPCWPDDEGANAYTLTSEANAMVAAALREAAELVADDHVSDAILNLADNHAAAALDKLIAEAVNEAMLQCTGIVANLRNKRNPGPLFEVLNMAMSDIEDARFAAIREKNNG